MNRRLPTVKVDRWHYRVSSLVIATCRIETWYDDKGGYNVLVTEHSDNPGPSVTNAHEVLRSEVEKWLDIPESLVYMWWEQYDSQSYKPPRDDLSEVSGVLKRADTGRWHWFHVPEEQWYEIYHRPREEVPTAIVAATRREISIKVRRSGQ